MFFLRSRCVAQRDGKETQCASRFGQCDYVNQNSPLLTVISATLPRKKARSQSTVLAIALSSLQLFLLTRFTFLLLTHVPRSQSSSSAASSRPASHGAAGATNKRAFTLPHTCSVILCCLRTPSSSSPTAMNFALTRLYTPPAPWLRWVTSKANLPTASLPTASLPTASQSTASQSTTTTTTTDVPTGVLWLQ
eukprot:1785949-Rhodomonas_salina.1